MLQGAAAAVAKMRAWRNDPVWARPQYLNHLRAFSRHPRADGFARQGQGGVEATGGQAVALGADRLDQQVGGVGGFRRRGGVGNGAG